MSPSSMHIVPSFLECIAKILLQFAHIDFLFVFAPEHFLDCFHEGGIAEKLLIPLIVGLRSCLKVVAIVDWIVKRIILSKNLNF